MITGPEPIPLSGRQVTLEQAAQMIPYRTVEALRRWLGRRQHLFPIRRRMFGAHAHRMLYESEVAAVGRMLVKQYPAGHFNRTQRQDNKRTG
jgi:hypothetical protein